ncbi:ABC transporter ATP-binding protein [Undibacter mobilis]|uniref:ABC transporter ATP-binding protein n=1 Tax=Undibacter mobilis TaxID=2292256 RepID=A0A371BDR5_9BRAD|nr:ABC transporter ATP-binding protein [Undibacter mobilis]RDV05739.1 ABC transporter ATP-binding protein [Undibacter mobilis]
MTYNRGAKSTQALQETSLTIRKGEFVSIVGPSGCGKSTLLKMVSGLLRPTSGTITVDQKVVQAPVTDLGIVFQSPVLLEWRTVLQNVLMQVELRGYPKSAYHDRAVELLTAVGLRDFKDQYPHELSGGMRQRASIVRALIHDPPLLLMDEPFGALDALTREQMRIDLENLWMSRPMTVVFVTHSLDEAVLLSDRVVVMSPRPGRVEQIINVDMERPRGLGARANPVFEAATRTITEIFLSRGVLQGGGFARH